MLFHWLFTYYYRYFDPDENTFNCNRTDGLRLTITTNLMQASFLDHAKALVAAEDGLLALEPYRSAIVRLYVATYCEHGTSREELRNITSSSDLASRRFLSPNTYTGTRSIILSAAMNA